jgi:ABC-type lipoprotein export system ATPase subunit
VTIELECVSKVYGKRDGRIAALHDVSLRVERGEMVAVMGPSGSGKSTLLNLLGLIDTPSSGSYRYAGDAIADVYSVAARRLRNERFGFVMQDYCLVPYCTVEQNVALPLRYSKKRIDRFARVREVLAAVGLEDRARAYPRDLSGGQQQRVAIARALANHPDFILADEPTGALDSKTGAAILDVLERLNAEGVGVVVVTHDERAASRCRRVVHLFDGRIVSDERST